MPLLHTIFEKIPTALLIQAEEQPLKKFTSLSREHQKIITTLDTELNDFLNELLLYLHNPHDANQLSDLLTLVITENEYNNIEKTIDTLYKTDWIANGKKASSLHHFYVAFLNKKHIQRHPEASLLYEKNFLEEKMTQREQEIKIAFEKKIKETIEKQIAQTDEMIKIAEEIKKIQTSDIILNQIPPELVQLLDENPIKKFDNLSDSQKNILTIVRSELTALTQEIALLFKDSPNSEQMLMVLVESLRPPRFDNTKTIVDKLLLSDWFGIGIDSAALVNLYSGLTLRDEINRGEQLSLESLKTELQLNGLHDSMKKNLHRLSKEIEIDATLTQLTRRIAIIDHLLNSAQLLKNLTELPAFSHKKPEYKALLRFEEKLKNKIADLDKDKKNKDKKDDNYDQYTQNKLHKKMLLESMLHQIHLHKTNAIPFEELLERTKSFQEVAQHFEHTNRLKSFLNKKFENIFAVDTKKLLDDFYTDLKKSSPQKK